MALLSKYGQRLKNTYLKFNLLKIGALARAKLRTTGHIFQDGNDIWVPLRPCDLVLKLYAEVFNLQSKAYTSL